MKSMPGFEARHKEFSASFQQHRNEPIKRATDKFRSRRQIPAGQQRLRCLGEGVAALGHSSPCTLCH